VFATLSDRLAATFKGLRSKGRLSDADIDATAREIRIALLEADVALPVVKEFVAAVKERARTAEVSGAAQPCPAGHQDRQRGARRILGGETRRLRFAKHPPTVIMLAGLQGSGKTTLAGKLALWLASTTATRRCSSPPTCSGRTLSPSCRSSVSAGVPVWAPEPGTGVGDPVQVARSGVDEARRRLHDVVIVDTAGRLGIDAEMMQQAADIRDAVEPDEILFVLDAMVGQDAVTTAQAFLDGVGFDGVVLTKLDGDARGGAALSVRSVTGRPVMFASNGERLEDFDAFHPERMASRILGMGDMLTLIEQAERPSTPSRPRRWPPSSRRERSSGSTTSSASCRPCGKMGPLTKIFGMLPGANQFKDALDNFDEREVDRVEAIIRSMTPAERADPKILNGSRRARIARGSGATVTDVNQLVERFFVARDMMSQAARGAMPSLPGMPGGSGKKSKGRAQKSAPAPRRAGGRGARSGNPAKRAAQLAEVEQRRQGQGAANVFGAPATPPDVADLELPAEFRDLLPPSR
jgi:signal recognition particle subunit SRP54